MFFHLTKWRFSQVFKGAKRRCRDLRSEASSTNCETKNSMESIRTGWHFSPRGVAFVLGFSRQTYYLKGHRSCLLLIQYLGCCCWCFVKISRPFQTFLVCYQSRRPLFFCFIVNQLFKTDQICYRSKSACVGRSVGRTMTGPVKKNIDTQLWFLFLNYILDNKY